MTGTMSASPEDAAPSAVRPKGSMDTLVVSYSLGGVTRRVANDIATALNADVDEIEDAVPRRGALGYLQSGIEALARGAPSIRTHRDPGKYALVVLGAPVWTRSMASPMRSYLFLHHRSLRQVAFFCTQRRNGAQYALDEMEAICGARGAPQLALSEREVAEHDYEAQVNEFVRALEQRYDFRASPTTFRHVG